MVKTIVILLLTLALLPFTVSAQEQKKSILDYSKITLGKCADGSDLMFHYIPADGELKGFTFTDSIHYMLITDGKGNHLYNTETLEYVGDLKFVDKRLSQITNDGYLAYSTGGLFGFSYGKPTFYDFNNNKIWSSKNEVLLSSRPANIVVCTQDRKGEKLIAYNMSTGKELWQTTIPYSRNYPWGDAYKDKNDKNILYLIGNSFIRLNVLTGDTISRPFTAGVKEPTSSMFSFAKRRKIIGSQFYNELVNSYITTGNSLTGIHSNILYSGDSIFVADANALYCFDKNLKTIWTTTFPKGTGAKSEIFFKNGKIYMQNFGIAFQRGLIGRYGKPFTAVYDKVDGKQLSFAIPNIEQKITGGTFMPGRAYWQSDKNLYYTDEGDTLAHKIEWKPNTSNFRDDYYANYVIYDTIGVVKGDQMTFIPTNKDQVVLEIYGKDFNIVHTDGTNDFLSSSDAYSQRSGNVYWTNNDNDEYNSFVIIDPKTLKVRYSFRIKGSVKQDKSGNIYVAIKQGVGFRQAQSSKNGRN